MQIRLMHPGQPVADFAISGAIVTIAGLPIDCAERQQDVSVLVEIRDEDGVAVEGGDGPYLAHIQIPSRRYAPAIAPQNDDEEGGGSDTGNPLPLDPNAVIVTLWPTY